MSSEGILDVYLSEINEVGLLKASEEIDLAKRIRKGDAEAREFMVRAEPSPRGQHREALRKSAASASWISSPRAISAS
jgi:hypothetical protein